MRKFSLLVFALIVAIGANAQFDLGIRGGLSSSQVKIEESANGLRISTGDNTFGYHLGAYSQITIKDKFVIMPEVLFTSTGGTLDLSDGADFKEIWELSYNRMDIPVTVGWKFLKILRVNAGPYVSFLLDADASFRGNNLDVKPNYQDVLWGYQAGLGLDIWKFDVDLKYEGSFHSYHNDNAKIPGTDVSYTPDSRANQWILSVGFAIF